ncbi:MAG: ferrochelatase [Pelagibacterales bacterium]|nr:ferrochelatase [Pelagibacterales bacterium]
MHALNKNSSTHPKVLYGKTGVLIVNLGTPDSYRWKDIRKYLKEFLNDRRVIETNKALWFLILNLIILTFRPHKTAKNYKKIWMKELNISPLKYYTQVQKDKLKKKLTKKNVLVDYAMRYGNPSIKEKILNLKYKGCENIIILPLYPQYAAPTTASVCDEVYRTLLSMRWQPSIQIIPHYESNPYYIKALANCINEALNKLSFQPDIIVFSYHGIPKKYFLDGDPYHCYCQKTTRLVKENMDIKIPFLTTFQSRFGPQEWLMPYTDETLRGLPSKGKKRVLILCPGFASDCIETLEEIEMEAKSIFLENGGKEFNYVPCLNDRKDHIDLLYKLVSKFL